MMMDYFIVILVVFLLSVNPFIEGVIYMVYLVITFEFVINSIMVIFYESMNLIKVLMVTSLEQSNLEKVIVSFYFKIQKTSKQEF